MTSFKSYLYFNKCDLISKYLLDNIHQQFLLNNFSIENKIINNNSSLKEDIIKFYTLLLFYFLSLRLPFIFFKKKKSLYFKLKFFEPTTLTFFLSCFGLEKNSILKKKVIKDTVNKSVGINFDLFLPNFYLNSSLIDIFDEFSFSKIQNLKLNIKLNINSKLQNRLKKTSKEQLFYNFNLLWLFNLINE
jgi:hypothetical protein